MGKLNILNRYAVIPNSILNNTKLSFKAKGLYAYIQSKPDDWNFSVENIAAQAKEGVESIRGAISELEQFGLLTRRKFQVEKGHWDIEYILHEVTVIEEVEVPTPKNPTSGNPSQENPRLENPASENPASENPPNNSKQVISNNDNTIVLSGESKDSLVDAQVIDVEVVEVPVIEISISEDPPEEKKGSAAAGKPKKPRASKKKDPSEYSIVHKLKLLTLELNPDYRWTGTDARHAKEIAAGIMDIGKRNTGREVVDDEILKYFRGMIKHIPKYFNGKWDLKKLNSEFNTITATMKKPETTGRMLDAMLEMKELSEKRIREGRVKTFNDE